MKADMSRNEAEDKKKRNVEKLKSTFNQGGRQCVLGRVSDLCKVGFRVRLLQPQHSIIIASPSSQRC